MMNNNGIPYLARTQYNVLYSDVIEFMEKYSLKFRQRIRKGKHGPAFFPFREGQHPKVLKEFDLYGSSEVPNCCGHIKAGRKVFLLVLDC